MNRSLKSIFNMLLQRFKVKKNLIFWTKSFIKAFFNDAKLGLLPSSHFSSYSSQFVHRWFLSKWLICFIIDELGSFFSVDSIRPCIIPSLHHKSLKVAKEVEAKFTQNTRRPTKNCPFWRNLLALGWILDVTFHHCPTSHQQSWLPDCSILSC